MSDKKKKKKKDKERKKSAKAAKPKKLLRELHCTGCKKRCPLADPECKKGRAQAEAALEGLKKK